MALSTNEKLGLGALGVAAVWYGFRRATAKPPLFFLPGSTIEAVMGQQVILRVPRGDYAPMGAPEQIEIVSQGDHGVHTDVAVQVGQAPLGYTADFHLIDVDDPGQSFRFTIIARRPHG